MHAVFFLRKVCDSTKHAYRLFRFINNLYTDLHPVLDCGELPDLDNGKVETPHTTTCGSEVTYSCNNGYLLEGVSSRTCEPNEQWSIGTIRCERKLLVCLHSKNR